MTPTPTADLQLIYRIALPSDPTYPAGTLVVDLGLTPGGDLATVDGSARLQQDITRWLLTPQGSNPFDPSYGNPLWAEAGRPASGSPDHILAMVEQAEAAFLQTQATAAAQGYISTDAQIASIENTTVTPGPVAGTSLISFTIITRAGDAVPTTLPFPGG